MAWKRGYKSSVGMGFEDSLLGGQAVPSLVQLPINSFGLKSAGNLQQRKTITGHRSPTKPFRGNPEIKGQLVMPMSVRHIGYPLKLAFGAPTTTDNGDGSYTHVFTIGDETPSAIFERALGGDILVRNTGVKVESLSFDCEKGSEQLMNFDLVGCTETRPLAAWDDTPDTHAFDAWEAFQGTLSQGATVLGIARKFSFTMNFGVEAFPGLDGKQGYTDFDQNLVELSFEAETKFENATYIDAALNETALDFAFEFVKDAHSLKFEWHECQVEESAPGIEGTQGILQPLKTIPYAESHADLSAVVITLTNDVETY